MPFVCVGLVGSKFYLGESKVMCVCVRGWVCIRVVAADESKLLCACWCG
jgi:hypothetical protein